MDKYDKEGRRLYYYVEEGEVSTKVVNEDKQEVFEAAEKRQENGNGPTYYLTADGYRYIQEIATKSNTDDNVDIEIKNRLVGNAEIKITKTFPKGISPTDLTKKEATVSFDVFQNNNKIGVITKTYKVGSTIQSYDKDGNLITTKIEDLTQLQKEFTDVIIVNRYDDPNDDMTLEKGFSKFTDLLPRYDHEGAEYTYSVFEHEDAIDHGYNPKYENIISEAVYKVTSTTDVNPYIADRDKYLVDEIKISNDIGEDEYITVYKEWLDGEESQKRQAVTFVLQHQKTAGSEWEDVSTPSTIDPTAEVYSKYSFMKIPTAVHDEFIDWRNNNYSPTETSGDFRVIETYMGSNPVHYYTGEGRTIVDDFPNKDYYIGHVWDKYSGDEATFSELQKKQYENDDYGFVQGNFYDYDVLICNSKTANGRYVNYQYTEDGNVIGNRNFDFAISNVRVGVIYIDVTKEWVDGRMAKTARPDALELQIKVGEKTKYEKTETVTLDDSNKWTAKLGPYRKYDDKGNLINYNPHLEKYSDDKYEKFVYDAGREDAAEKYKNAYVMSGNTAEFELGKDHHTGDRYSFAIKNTLSATITPVVNKFWDDYDDRDNDRPDIYSHLYRKYTDDNNVDHVELLDTKSYIDYDWDTTSFDKKAHNWWQVKYNPQSRFTKEFYEYDYYISESYASENTNEYVEIGAYEGAPKYTDVSKNVATFSTVNKTIQKLEYEENGEKKVIVAAKVALDEDDAGTLVNRPRNKRTVSGVKIYENLPDGYSNKNLPDVELELWRRPYGEPEGSPKEEKVPEYDIIRDLMGQEDIEATDNNLVAILEGANELYKRNFTFYKGNKTENDEDKVQAYVPKYDNTGRPYTYFVKEADTYSILDAKKGDKETAERIKVLHAAYDFEVTENDTLTNGVKAVNKYKETKNYSVKFCKKWDGFKPENEYDEKYLDPVQGNDMPKITIRLYRYLQNADGNIINGTGKKLDEQELTYKIDKNDPDKSGYAYAEWNDLVYYAPNLNPYKYVISEKVEETSDGGKVPNTRAYDVYNASVAVDEDGNYILENGHAKLEAKENLKTGASSKITFDETRSAKATASTIEERKVVRHDSSWDGYDVAVDGSYDIDSGKGSGVAGIINTYRKDREPLKVLKLWDTKDSGYDGINILLEEIHFNLYRLYHNNSTAADNRTLIKKDDQDYTFTLNEANGWTATISELLKYEPTRGYYYRYYVEEVKPEGWKNYAPFVVETRDGSFWYGGAGVKNTPDGVVYLDGGVDGTNPPDGKVVDESGKGVTVTGRKNVFKTIDLHAVKKFKTGNGNKEISGEKLLELYNKKALPETITYHIYYQIQDGKNEWKRLELKEKDPDTNENIPVTMESVFRKTVDENGKETGAYSIAEKTGLFPYAYDDVNHTYHEIKYRAVEYLVTYPEGADGSTIVRTVENPDSISGELAGETNGTGFGEFSKVESVYDVTGEDGTITSEVISAELSHEDAVAKKTVSFEYLPTKDSNGNEYSYRAVEKKIVLKDGTVVDVTGNENGTGNQEGGTIAYEYKSENTDPEKSEGIYTKVLKTDFTNRLRLGSISVSKIWDDMDDKYELRTDINVRLTASVDMNDKSGEKSISKEIKTLNAANGYKESWSELPIYDADGTAINYTVKEYAVVEGKEVELNLLGAENEVPEEESDEDAEINLTEGEMSMSNYSNIHRISTVDIDAVKKWDDSDDKYVDRPEEIKVTLYATYTDADGSEVTEEVKNLELAYGEDKKITNPETLKASNDWKASWTGLPAYKRGLVGSKITYSVEETEVKGYTGDITLATESSIEKNDVEKWEFSIKNTLDPVDIVVTKNWDNEFAGIGDGVTGAEVVLQRKTGAADWANVYETFDGKESLVTHVIDKTDSSWTVKDLPRFDKDGNEYSYRAVESRIILSDGRKVNVKDDGLVKGTVGAYVYTSTTGKTGTGFRTDITNRMDTASLKVSKIWDDENNSGNRRPAEIKVNLKTVTVSDGKENEINIDGIAKTVTLSAGNSWTDTTTWDDVPVYTADGKRIYYVLSEENVSDYTASYSSGTYGQAAVTGSGSEAVRVYLENGQTSEVQFTNYYRPNGGGHDDDDSSDSSGDSSDSSGDSSGSSSNGNVLGADRETPDEGSVLGADRDMPEEPSVLGAARRPGTGDMSHMTIYGIISVFSLAVLGAWLSVYKKKKKA